MLFKNIFNRIEELLALGGLAQGFLELPQQLLLLPVQTGGDLHHHGDQLVAPAAAVVHIGDALLPEPGEIAAKKQMFGVKNAEYKKFSTYDEAKAWLGKK